MGGCGGSGGVLTPSSELSTMSGSKSPTLQKVIVKIIIPIPSPVRSTRTPPGTIEPIAAVASFSVASHGRYAVSAKLFWGIALISTESVVPPVKQIASCTRSYATFTLAE